MNEGLVTIVVQDHFTRSVPSGWGNAPSGQSCSPFAATAALAVFSVDGERDEIRFGSDRGHADVLLGSVTAQEVRVAVTVTVPTEAAVKFFEMGVFARSANNRADGGAFGLTPGSNAGPALHLDEEARSGDDRTYTETDGQGAVAFPIQPGDTVHVELIIHDIQRPAAETRLCLRLWLQGAPRPATSCTLSWRDDRPERATQGGSACGPTSSGRTWASAPTRPWS